MCICSEFFYVFFFVVVVWCVESLPSLNCSLLNVVRSTSIFPTFTQKTPTGAHVMLQLNLIYLPSSFIRLSTHLGCLFPPHHCRMSICVSVLSLCVPVTLLVSLLYTMDCSGGDFFLTLDVFDPKAANELAARSRATHLPPRVGFRLLGLKGAHRGTPALPPLLFHVPTERDGGTTQPLRQQPL